MAKNTAQVQTNVINQAQSVDPPPLGIVFLMGVSAKGIPNNPEDIITSVSQFERLYGGLMTTSNCPLHVEQAIRAGAKVRFSKIVGSGASPASYLVKNTGAVDNLFTLISKGYGLYYNAYEITIAAAASGLTNGFDLTIHDPTLGVTEEYLDLLITGEGGAAPYTYLKDVVENSRLVDVLYADISALADPQVPAFVSAVNPTGGLEGSAPTITQYTGSQSAKTGFYSFDDYDDGLMLGVPAENDTLISGLQAAGKAYVILRGDLVYFQHLDNDNNTATLITGELSGFAHTSKLVVNIGGGQKVTDTLLGGVKSMQNLGQVLGVIAKSHGTYGPWISPANAARGVLPEALGVVNNFGSPASLADLNLISNAGGNMVVLRNNNIYLKDFYTMAAGNSPEKFASVIFLELYLIKSLTPILEGFLNDPNTFATWKRIYYTVKPFIDNLVDQLAIEAYTWNGDQFATSADDMVINDPIEVDEGLYKVELELNLVVPMVTIQLSFILNQTAGTVTTS